MLVKLDHDSPNRDENKTCFVNGFKTWKLQTFSFLLRGDPAHLHHFSHHLIALLKNLSVHDRPHAVPMSPSPAWSPHLKATLSCARARKNPAPIFGSKANYLRRCCFPSPNAWSLPWPSPSIWTCFPYMNAVLRRRLLTGKAMRSSMAKSWTWISTLIVEQTKSRIKSSANATHAWRHAHLGDIWQTQASTSW